VIYHVTPGVRTPVRPVLSRHTPVLRALARESTASSTSSSSAPSSALASRRTWIARLLAAGGCAISIAQPPVAHAFANRVADIKYKANPGRPPLPLGVRADGTLQGCDGVKPNCFSTEKLDGPDEDIELYSSYLIPRWVYTGPGGSQAAFEDIKAAIGGYKPGANNIDGGGFEVQKSDSTYLYVQFESKNHGYVDDMEFKVVESSGEGGACEVQVRSASRVGFLDLGVNSKRLNVIAASLPADRWETQPITPKTHGNYFALNGPYLV